MAVVICFGWAAIHSFSRNWLEYELHFNTWGHLLEKGGCYVPNLVVSLITYPPLAQLTAWLRLFCFPQMQTVGMPCGRHPYLRAMASRNAPLCKAKPCSSIGRTVSHTDVPFSCASPIAFFMVGGSCSQTSTASLAVWLLFFSFMNFNFLPLLVLDLHSIISTTISYCVLQGLADGSGCGV